MNVIKFAAVAAIAVFALSGASIAADAKKTAVVAKSKCDLTMEGKAGANQVAFTITPAGESMTYNWTVSAGSISSGQGTNAITVDVTGLTKGQNVTATAEVDGLDASCKGKATLSSTTELQ